MVNAQELCVGNFLIEIDDEVGYGQALSQPALVLPTAEQWGPAPSAPAAGCEQHAA